MTRVATRRIPFRSARVGKWPSLPPRPPAGRSGYWAAPAAALVGLVLRRRVITGNRHPTGSRTNGRGGPSLVICTKCWGSAKPALIKPRSPSRSSSLSRSRRHHPIVIQPNCWQYRADHPGAPVGKRDRVAAGYQIPNMTLKTPNFGRPVARTICAVTEYHLVMDETLWARCTPARAQMTLVAASGQEYRRGAIWRTGACNAGRPNERSGAIPKSGSRVYRPV
jgi:hypothetical protein